MRRLLFSAVVVGAGCIAHLSAMATPLTLPGLNSLTSLQRRLRKSAIGNACTGVMATLYPTPTIRRRTATIRHLPRTLIRRLSMATNRPRLRMLHQCMVIRRLRLPAMETIPPQKATAATIRPQMETIHPRKATIRPRMAPKPLSIRIAFSVFRGYRPGFLAGANRSVNPT